MVWPVNSRLLLCCAGIQLLLTESAAMDSCLHVTEQKVDRLAW